MTDLDKQIDEILEHAIFCDDVEGKSPNCTTYEDVKQSLLSLISEQTRLARGCIDCKKLRCENCERLWQT